MSILIKHIIPFKKFRIISKCKKSKNSFIPLYDDRGGYDFGWLANDGSDPEEIICCRGQLTLAWVYYYSGLDIGLAYGLLNNGYKIKGYYPHQIDYINKILMHGPKPSGFMELYLHRHSMEVAMKAFLQLMNVKLNPKKPHDLLYLWSNASLNDSPTIYTIFKEYDCIVGSNICSDMNNFIVWLDDFEKSLNKGHKGENPYRYLLYPYNKILNTELYIDVNFLSEYIMKFLSIIEIMIFEYIKKVPKWNEKCVRWDNTHFEMKVWDSYIANNI